MVKCGYKHTVWRVGYVFLLPRFGGHILTPVSQVIRSTMVTSCNPNPAIVSMESELLSDLLCWKMKAMAPITSQTKEWNMNWELSWRSNISITPISYANQCFGKTNQCFGNLALLHLALLQFFVRHLWCVTTIVIYCLRQKNGPLI